MEQIWSIPYIFWDLNKMRINLLPFNIVEIKIKEKWLNLYPKFVAIVYVEADSWGQKDANDGISHSKPNIWRIEDTPLCLITLLSTVHILVRQSTALLSVEANLIVSWLNLIQKPRFDNNTCLHTGWRI